MKNKILPALALLGCIGCAIDPQAAAERRANLMEKVLPDPADRQGLHLVFPMESAGLYDTLLITHYTQEVSRAEVLRRVTNYCRGIGSPRLTGEAVLVREISSSPVTIADGSQKPAFEGRYDCVAA